ncbi:hypothetical protein [Campylobacter sp.]|uniref:hypothetical protein n=1 Tax=Campylobacter sp. TaxID=205 RepID=UPI002A824535|nr:hypothetical protein [Campylobacter sp.]MDY4155042.1 hypothetical protein [Campylobacter sp.]
MEIKNLLIEKIKKAQESPAIEEILKHDNYRFSYLIQVKNIIEIAYYFFNSNYYPNNINFYDFISKEIIYEDLENQHIFKFNLNDIETLNEFEKDKIRKNSYYLYDREIIKYLCLYEVIYHLGLTPKGMKIYTKIKLMEHKNKDKPKEIIELKTQKILAKYINNKKIKNKTMKNFERLYIDNITL